MNSIPSVAGFHPQTCWCITDGRPGMENQAIGLAEAMGLQPIVKRIVLKTLWRVLSPHITAFKRYAFSADSDRLEAPWPDIVIATGRPSILPALYVKGQSGEKSFLIQLQDPVSLRSRFDCIVVPAHDGLTGTNVISMDGALHRMTPDMLQREGERWADKFKNISRPKVAVLLGGTNSRYLFGKAEAAQLGKQLKALSDQGYGLLITPSRRTGDANMAILSQALAETSAFIWDGVGDNPYYGMLALADTIIVTCDSVNMISEACSTGKPVFMMELASRNGQSIKDSNKFVRFQRRLQERGCLRLFEGALDIWNYEPLHEMQRVADHLWQSFDRRQAQIKTRRDQVGG